MKVIETWNYGDAEEGIYFKLKLKENEYLDVKRFEDGYAYVLYDAVYRIDENKEEDLFRNCTQEENDLALKLVDEYYNNNLKRRTRKMKVKELIKQLKEFDPEARVYSDSYEGKGIDEILCSFSFVDNGDVILEHADQFDMKCEIGQMLDDYLEDGWDEADAYREMCDRGYTPDVVSKYYDKYTGECMKKYCNEHGIDY